MSFAANSTSISKVFGDGVADCLAEIDKIGCGTSKCDKLLRGDSQDDEVVELYLGLFLGAQSRGEKHGGSLVFKTFASHVREGC